MSDTPHPGTYPLPGGHEGTDRYAALGYYPDPATKCHGQCDGMGCYPVSVRDHSPLTTAEQRELTAALERGNTEDNIGYVMIRCPTCEGTGKARPPA
jgi:hypothetical protein